MLLFWAAEIGGLFAAAWATAWLSSRLVVAGVLIIRLINIASVKSIVQA